MGYVCQGKALCDVGTVGGAVMVSVWDGSLSVSQGAGLHALVRLLALGRGYVCLWVRLGDVVACVLWGTFVALVSFSACKGKSLCCRSNCRACAVWPRDIEG